MAWDEWEQLKAKAAAQGSALMQLNQLDDGNGGRGGPGTGQQDATLQVNQKSLAAIGDEAFKLFGRLERDAKHAKAASSSAAGSMREDFSIGAALAHVVEKWDSQSRSVLDACAHISNHLEYSQKAHRNDDERVLSAISSIAKLDDGFDDRDRRR